jgi:biopolymer transport protein ExbD
MRLRQLHPHQPAGKINVTPLIDVVMVLIIFYLIVGKMATDRKVDLPRAGVGITETGAEPVTVDVIPTQTGVNVLVAGRLIAPTSVDEVLRDLTRGRSRPVRIRAPKDMPYGKLEGVLVACRKAGLPSVRLVAERAE